MISTRNRFIAVAIAAYVLLGLAWILLSDQLLASIGDVEGMLWLSSAKGVFFVITSALGFLFALRAVPAAASSNDGLLEALAAALSPGKLPRWLGYAFAVAITLATLLLRERLALGFGGRPLLVLLVFPVILSALLGGLGPGLAATALAGLGALYLAIPPPHSLAVANPHDLLPWCFLIANGVAVSLLSEALRRSLARAEGNRRLLETIVSGTSDAVFVKDASGRYLLANTATAAFAGQAQDTIVGHDDHFLFPESVARELQAQDQRIMAAGRTQTHEERLTTFDGREMVFLATKGPLFDPSGRLIGLFGISRDITERKRAEDQIQRLNNDLERRVEERTAELSAANLELEDLAYALTHNMRAPLRAIGAFAQLLREDHGSRLEASAAASLEQIVEGAESMGRLLDGLLALLRCTRGKLRRESVDISALATRRLAELARAEPQRQVSTQVAGGLCAVGDPAMLELALRQLLDNAWKFTRDAADAEISVAAGALGGARQICVADNGAGFDMAHAQHLFEPFQRLHRQDEFAGIGVGLAIARRIARRHGGDIRAASAPGAGATFCLCLPPAAPTLENHHG